jgi:hypothetical protein
VKQGEQYPAGYRSRNNKMTDNHTASLLAITDLFQGTDNITINNMREPSANSSQLAWAWGQTSWLGRGVDQLAWAWGQMCGDPGSYWRQVPCGSVYMATVVPQTVGSALLLHSFWIQTNDSGFQRTENVGKTLRKYIMFSSLQLHVQAQPFKARITFELIN